MALSWQHLCQKAMKKTKYISLFLTFIGLMLLASISNAQVTATATVTLTVIPAPGVNFSPAKSNASSAVVASNLSSAEPAITLRGSSNMLLQLNSSNSNGNTQINFQRDQVKTLTAKDLRGVSSVEIVYLGS